MGKNKSRWIHCAECGRNRLHKAHGLCEPCYVREWRQENAEYVIEYNREHAGVRAANGRRWRERHCKERREYDRQWKKANPEKRHEQNHLRRARKRNAAIGPVDIAAIYERDKVCVYCGATEGLTLDHLIPLARGGAHCQDNLAVACRRCNSRKGTKTYDEFMGVKLDSAYYRAKQGIVGTTVRFRAPPLHKEL